jgi:hypothetical protein
MIGFFDNLTWRCDICHEERPDEKISVRKIDTMCPHGCVACGAPCQRNAGHKNQHECINCGTRWYDDAE